MDFPSNINIPVSSDDPVLGLLECYLGELEDNQPPSSYTDYFEQESTLFDLFVESSKYLGSDLFYLSGDGARNKTTTITNEITNGQNYFELFNGRSTLESLSIPLSSSVLTLSATAGTDLSNSDILWQFQKNRLDGAWLKRSDRERINTQANIKLGVGQTEFLFPYPFRGLSSSNGWTGKGIDNCRNAPYFQETDGVLLSSVEGRYWSDTTSLSSVDSVSLLDTTIIADGANSSRNIFEADQILLKTDREATDENFSWAFQFNHTELPIRCGSTQLYWPLTRYDESDKSFPFTIKPDFVEDIALSSLWITKNMCGAIGGTTPETADRFYEKSSECGEKLLGAWLSAGDISFCSDISYLSASNEHICSAFDFFLSGTELYLSAEYSNPDSSDLTNLNCCQFENGVTNFAPNLSVLSSVGGVNAVASIVNNGITWGQVNSNSTQSQFLFQPKTYQLTLGENIEIGQILYTNGVSITGTNINSFTANLNFLLNESLPITVDIDSTVNNQSNSADTISISNTFQAYTVELCGKLFEVEVFVGEVTGSDTTIKQSFSAEENDTTTVPVYIRVSPFESSVIRSAKLIDFGYDPADYTANLSIDGCVLILDLDPVDEQDPQSLAYEITSNGTDTIFITHEKETKSFIIEELMQAVRPQKIEVSNGSRQSGLHAIFPSGESKSFFWEFPDKDFNEIIQGYEHDDYCDYLKISNYSSIVNEIGEQAQWTQCNCKAQYYSPFGHDLPYDDYSNYIDIVYEDNGSDSFSPDTWRDLDGFNYKDSPRFGMFRYQGREPDVGFGIGIWKTYSGDPVIIEKGRTYRYLRASFGGCSGSPKPPCLVVNNCHCLDKCHEDVSNLQWIKLSPNEDGTWSDTGIPTDIVLQSGKFYEYQKQDSISFDIVRNGACITRTTSTPSFSLNVSFDTPAAYWAQSPRLGGLNYGLSATETDGYLLTTQPEPSEMVLFDNAYVKYFRNDCSALKWEQPLTFTVDFEIPPTWKKIDFGWTSPPLLQKIVGCSTCDLVYEDSGDSCFLFEDSCNSFIASLSATNIDSDIILRSPLDCSTETSVFYEARESFTWEEEFDVTSSPTSNVLSGSFAEAPRPWAHLLNGSNSVVHFDEGETHTGDQLGLFKPKNVCTHKIECFE